MLAFKKQRVLNIISSLLSKNDSYDLLQKQIPSDSIFKSTIRLDIKKNIESLENNKDLIKSTTSHQNEISWLIQSNAVSISSNHYKSSFLNVSSNTNSSHYENKNKNSRFSGYFGLISSALFGYFAVKMKKSKNESVKVMKNDDSDEISNKNEGFMSRNILKNRVTTISYAANNPIEDRYNAIQLRNLDGYFVEVLDGHGGYQVAEYASKKLHIYFDEKIKELKKEGNISEDEMIITAINFAFASVENDMLKTAKDAFDKGSGEFIFIGSCALAIIVHDNKLYVANCGDSKAKLFSYNGYNYSPIKLSNTLNAGSKKEQLRLRTDYKDEDIFICKRNSPKACYVKGRLQPTRVIKILIF